MRKGKENFEDGFQSHFDGIVSSSQGEYTELPTSLQMNAVIEQLTQDVAQHQDWSWTRIKECSKNNDFTPHKSKS